MGYFILFLIIGLSVFFGPVFTSGFDLMPGSLIDGNFINYILEHFYLVISGTSEIHTEFWSLPIFYPMKNTLAYSDTLFSIAPIYLLFRLFFDSHISHTLTVISISILNYTVFYFILRKINFSKLLSSLGAFLYAFSYVNHITLMHIQLTIQFFSLAALLAVMNISKKNSKLKNNMLFLAASLLYIMQFYSSYYIAFFSALIVLFIITICLFDRTLRKKLKIFILRYKLQLLSSFIFVLLLILPAIYMYYNNGVTRDYSVIINNLPSLIYFFKGNSFFIENVIPFMSYKKDIELMLMFTYAIFFFGIIGLSRFKIYGKFLLTLFFAIILFSMKFESLNNFSLWQYIFMFIPGASAIREPVRIILLLNPLLVLGFIKFVSTCNYRKGLLILIILFAIFEQFTMKTYLDISYENEQKIQKEIDMIPLPPQCKYIDIDFYVGDPYDIYAVLKKEISRLNLMKFASRHNLYFVSGYSGVSEESDFENPYRNILRKTKGYCSIKRYLDYPKK